MIGPVIIAAALVTPVWFAARIVARQTRNARAVRAWSRVLEDR